jgi:hypothetical protein
MAEIGDGGDPERALGALDKEGVSMEFTEDGVKMAKVVRPRPAVDQNIVKEHEHEAAKKRAQHVAHEGLERGWGVAQPERHHEELI